MEKVVLGLSGGVDSAVTAGLLKRQGFDVTGLFLDIGQKSSRDDAQEVADFWGIPLIVKDISEELEENVCNPFTQCYIKGETPNPCILCNPKVKFKTLCDAADKIGAEYIATGHYARSINGNIYRALSTNDQSYMLCRLLREQANRLILPLGEFPKTEIRKIAEEMGVPVAKKPDSMEICFIPDKDYIGWISKRAKMPPAGDIMFHGEVIGQHEGIHRYTVGQRLPGLHDGVKIYVTELDPVNNLVIAATSEELFKTEVRVRDMSWMIEPPKGEVKASVKVRHTKLECPTCTVFPGENGEALIVCDSPVRAPARGQAAAIYDGDMLLGGGIII